MVFVEYPNMRLQISQFGFIIINRKNEICALHNCYNKSGALEKKNHYYKKIDDIIDAKIIVNITT